MGHRVHAALFKNVAFNYKLKPMTESINVSQAYFCINVQRFEASLVNTKLSWLVGVASGG